jgi:guanylate kinase
MTSASSNKNLLVVMSGPSGVGKTSIRNGLLKACKGMVCSVSCTTRKPRGREVNGKDYYFLSESEFATRVKRGELLEHAVVHGCRYGTPRGMVEQALSSGKDVLLVIDVQGAEQVRARVRKEPDGGVLKRGFVDIFVMPPSMEELAQRLKGRREDPPEVVERRLANARQEMACSDRFKHRVVNENIEGTVNQLRQILDKERCAEANK